jgi:phosphatidate cytidylyltransferase
MSSMSDISSSDLHRRRIECQIDTNSTKSIKKEGPGALSTEDDDMEPLPSQPSGANMLNEQSLLQKSMHHVDQLLSGLDARWRNPIIRGIFSFLMITLFAKLVSMGPVVVSLVILFIQIKCFQEIIDIGYFVYKSHNLPWFRTLSWYFLFASNYWLYGQSLIQRFGFFISKSNILQSLVVYHRMIAFLLHTSGFVGFVISLKKTYYLKQFTLFGYTHITLLILVTSSHQMIQNIFEGNLLIASFHTCSCRITNDTHCSILMDV